MPSYLILLVILTLTVFQPDETIRRYGGDDQTWHLVTLDDAPFEATATITFPSRNRITGSGPCNTYNSNNFTPYPWIEVGPIAATRRACPDLAAESAFFEALSAARIAIVEGDTLTMSRDEDVLLIFKSRD